MIDFIRFGERYKHLDGSIPHPEIVSEVHVQGLYIRIYAPEKIVKEVLIVYRGVEVNSDAGDDIPAWQLSCLYPFYL